MLRTQHAAAILCAVTGKRRMVTHLGGREELRPLASEDTVLGGRVGDDDVLHVAPDLPEACKSLFSGSDRGAHPEATRGEALDRAPNAGLEGEQAEGLRERSIVNAASLSARTLRQGVWRDEGRTMLAATRRAARSEIHLLHSPKRSIGAVPDQPRRSLENRWERCRIPGGGQRGKA